MKTGQLQKLLRLLGLACLLVAQLPPAAIAGDGHDHGDTAPAASGHGPRRLPDGSVFLPKPAQRQIGVRTLLVEAGELPQVVELAGTVVMDPNAGGKVQPTQAGRVEAGPRGLPVPGQRMSKGEVLAYVVPNIGAIERAGQVAQLAELQAARTLADKRLQRLHELADTVPRKEIDALESEHASLDGRIRALQSGLQHREALLAPISGVIAAAQVVAGQVVDARELLFEIVDPAQLRIEALAYDIELGRDIAAATLALGTRALPLQYLGHARSLREQALPLQFRTSGAALAALALGQKVHVFVQTARKVAGLRVPATALQKSPTNQTIVWVKTAPERFEPRVVSAEPLDGVSVAITAGLKPGERVATVAATLINQIR